MTDQDEKLSAYHQAGHTVARLHLAQSFGEVTIDVCPPASFGSMDPGLFEFDRDDEENVEFSMFTQASMERTLVALFAGEAATFILTGERDSERAGRHTTKEGGMEVADYVGDAAAIQDLLVGVFGVAEPDSPAEHARWAYEEWMWWRTVCLLRKPIAWRAVEDLAQALMRRRTLTKEDALAAIREGAEGRL